MILALLLGCDEAAPCTSFADTQVTAPDGADDALVEEVRGYVDAFAGWTGLDGVCVDEVRLVDAIPDHDGKVRAGRYLGTRIEIDQDYDYALDDITLHELCHAFDHAAGWISRTRPDLFGDAAIEGFADRCEEGPEAVALTEAREQRCGADFGSAVTRFLGERVYREALAYDPAPVGTFAVTLDRRAFTALGRDDWDWSVPLGGDALYLADRVFGPDGEDVAVRLDIVDPRTARIVRHLDAPDLAATPVSYFQGETGGVLVPRHSDLPAWRFDGKDGALTAAAVPGFYDAYGGAVIGDTLYLTDVEHTDGVKATFERVDLVTGAWTTLDTPGTWERWRPAPLDGTLAGLARYGPGERVWVTYDPATARFTEAPLPASLYYSDAAPLPDGRVLLAWHDYVGDSTWDEPGLALFDPADGSWRIAEDPCGDDRPGMTTELHTVDGVPYLWEYPNGWRPEDGPRGQMITRIVIE